MVKNRDAALVSDLEGVAEGVRGRVVLFRLLLVVAGQLRARMDSRYRAAGITTQQAAVLALASVGAPPTQGELARLLGVTHQNIRQIADALVRKGLLDVRAEAKDRRLKRLVPTRRVAPLFARRNADDFDAVAAWFSVLDDEEIVSLRSQLGRLLASFSPGEGGGSADLPRAASRRTPSSRGRRR